MIGKIDRQSNAARGTDDGADEVVFHLIIFRQKRQTRMHPYANPACIRRSNAPSSQAYLAMLWLPCGNDLRRPNRSLMIV